VALPNLSYQRKVSAQLKVAQQEITLLQNLAEHYRIQKRGLMQKLLTGEWRSKEIA
jgi:type I restriction enzyme S subunit